MGNHLTTSNQNSTSISQPIAPDRGLSDLVAAYRNGLERENGITTVGQLPSRDHRRLMEARRDDLGQALRPASLSEADKRRAAKAIASMLSAWIHTGRNDPKDNVASYVSHLQDLPAFAIERACHDVARGYVEGLSPDFPPSAPRLHQLAMEACAALRTEQADIVELLGATQRYEPTAEERARVADGFKALGRSLSAATVDPEADHRKAQAARRQHEAEDRHKLREYESLGIEPQYATDGVLISPALLQSLGRMPQKRESAA